MAPSDDDSTETHISRVFLTDDRAYKLLKPVTTTFLDFADRAQRLAAARRELELNRRLAPDVYLGLADVHEGDELVDHMVVMVRMPAERRLSTLLCAGNGARGAAAASGCLRAVARQVASLHLSAPPLTGDDAAMATRDAVAANWEDNFAVIAPHVGSIIDPGEYEEVRRLARDYLEVGSELFRRRIEGGWIRDGHGDLRAEDVFCLEDGPRILDCLAFSDDLRIGDVLADIGFLVMDVRHLAGERLAGEVMAAYQEFTGETHPSSLAHHYVGYRAHVRVKVACLRHGQGDPTAAAEAQELHRIVLEQLRVAEPTIVVVGGGPGTGKSTVARHLSAQLGLALVCSDEIRKELAGLGHLDSGEAEPGEGIYSPEMSDRVYDEVLRQAEVLLSLGEPVVLDASWSSERHRRSARAVAARRRARLVEIDCRLDRAVAKGRVATRTGDPSDATPEVVDHLANRADPWPEAIGLETDGPAEHVGARAVELAGPNPPGRTSRS